MIEDRQITVETTGGYRPPTGLGERILLVLAGLALVGGALIAVTNFLPKADETADASPQASAEATARPSRTPRPRATPTPFPDPPPIIGLIPGLPSPAEDEVPYVPGGWVRALVDVTIYESPSLRARSVGTLAAGELAAVDSFSNDTQGFVAVYVPEPSGWVQLEVDGVPQVDVFPVQQLQAGVTITRLSAGPNGYVASGFQPGEGYVDNRIISLASHDGINWVASESEQAAGWEPPVVAWGPAGWLSVAISYGGQNGPQAWIGISPDGLRWTTLGRLQLAGGAYPIGLASSAEGYLLAVVDYSRATSASTIWFSTDGRQWEQRPSPLNDEGEFSLAGVPGGFLAWVEASRGNPSRVSFSRDGYDWVAADDGPLGNALSLAPLGADGVLAIDLQPGGSVANAWVGRISDGRLSWERDPSGVVFSGGAVSSMAGYGSRAVAVGWDLQTSAARAWQYRGDEWTVMPAPEGGFGTMPLQVTAGPTGFVALGGRPSLVATNPVFWRSTGGEWRAESSPAVPAAPDPSEEDCGPPITDALGFVTTPSALAVICSHGDPISFVAWSARCEGCYGTMGGVSTEKWLAQPEENQLYLSPIEMEGGYWTEAVLHPDLQLAVEYVDQWVRVTGHYDDPAAQRCTLAPDPLELFSYFGYPGGWGEMQSIQNQCRMRFVVTSLEPLGRERP